MRAIRMVLVVGLLLGASTARADLALEVDVDAAFFTDDAFDVGAGVGAGGRVGYRSSFPGLSLTPEVGVSYRTFDGRGLALSLLTANAGARLAIGEVLTPFVAAHLGLARYGVDVLGLDASETNPAFDVGAGLDFTLLPLLDLGVHVFYNTLLDDAPAAIGGTWFTAGVHAALIL